MSNYLLPTARRVLPGPVLTAQPKPERVQVTAVHAECKCPSCGFKFRPGETGEDLPFAAGKPGKKMTTRIKEMLNERTRNADGSYNYRFDTMCKAFLNACESGSFHHLRELMDRIDGRVPSRVANAEGENIKAYIALPVEGEEAP